MQQQTSKGYKDDNIITWSLIYMINCSRLCNKYKNYLRHLNPIASQDD